MSTSYCYRLGSRKGKLFQALNLILNKITKTDEQRGHIGEIPSPWRDIEIKPFSDAHARLDDILRVNKLQSYGKFHALILLCVLCGRGFSQQLPALSYGTQVFNTVGGPGPVVSPVPTLGVPTNQDPVLPPLCGTHSGDKCAINNTGMGAHAFTYCLVSGTLTSIVIWGEATDDNTITSFVSTPAHWQPITPIGGLLDSTGCATLEGGENHRFIRLHLDSIAGVNPKISAWYRGIGTALVGKGASLSNQGSQPVTFNPANIEGGSVASNFFTTKTGLTLAKSTPVVAVPSSNVLVGISASNPNMSPVFASLQCNGITPVTIFQWLIPANDIRPPVETGSLGTYCSFNALVFCSTSQSAAVDPANSCLFNIAYKPMNSIPCEVSFAGATICTQQQIPN